METEMIICVMCEWIDVHDIEIMKSSDAHSNSHFCAQSVNTYN